MISTGASGGTFELHVIEILYHNLANSLEEDLYDSLYGDICKVYNLDGPPKYSYPATGSFFWTMAQQLASRRTNTVSNQRE